VDAIITDDINMIYHDLQQYCEHTFGFKIYHAAQINRGFLNLKWKIETSEGIFLLKQYNHERLKKYDMDQLLTALRLQQKLHFEGVACPKILTNSEKMMHVTDNDERFVIIEFCEGKIVKPGLVNENQMYDLGCQTGKMHRLLSEFPINDPNPQFIPPSKESRLNHWLNIRRDAEVEDKQWLQPIIDDQIKATEALDFSKISVLECGLAHRDLWVDNILFHENKLSAILDFDRLRYDYPELDIARAIISCSLLKDDFLKGNAMAFLEGYRTERDFPQGRLESAMWMLWFMESTWWIDKNMDMENGLPPARFAEEMIWLAKNHSELNEMFGSL
jgi:homoserine kinase type II